MNTKVLIKYNELKFIRDKNKLISYLQENYTFFGTKLKLMGFITTLSIQNLEQLFLNNGFNCNLNEEILQCSVLIKEQNKTRNLEFFCVLDPKSEKLIIFTFIASSDLYIIERVISNSSNISYLWISPKTLDELKDEIIDSNEDTRITGFTAKRFDNMKERCQIRPWFKRSFRYGGDDGKETLKELRINYGVLPRVIQFKISKVAEFKINFRGIFTFSNGDLTYVLGLLDYAFNNILETKRNLEISKYSIVHENKKFREFYFEKIIPVSINLSSTLSANTATDLINQIINSNIFFPINYSIIEGSLYFTSTILDKVTNETFRISSNGEEIILVKDKTTSFASMIKFFQFIIERVDVDAGISKIKDESRL